MIISLKNNGETTDTLDYCEYHFQLDSVQNKNMLLTTKARTTIFQTLAALENVKTNVDIKMCYHIVWDVWEK